MEEGICARSFVQLQVKNKFKSSRRMEALNNSATLPQEANPVETNSVNEQEAKK